MRADFPTRRDGWDPEAVREHLQEVATEHERLRARLGRALAVLDGSEEESSRRRAVEVLDEDDLDPPEPIERVVDAEPVAGDGDEEISTEELLEQLKSDDARL